MGEFNWEAFCAEKSDIVVHCKTEEEAKDFCAQMHRHGLCWCSYNSYLHHTNYKKYTYKTCYTGAGTFQSLDYFIKLGNNYKIMEWSDYMTIPRDILKPGHMVELRNGHAYMYLPYAKGYAFIKEHSDPVNLKHYDCDLNYSGNKCFDVIKIWGLTNLAQDIMYFIPNERPLLWERKERPEIKMTVDEMKQKLEEILNAKIVEE